MRYRISTLLLVTALLAVMVGWVVERRNYRKNLSEATKRESLVTSALSIAMTTNRLYSESGSDGNSTNDAFRRKQLFANVVFLFEFEPYFVERSFVQTELFTSRLAHDISVFDESGKSLSLLGIESSQQFLDEIRELGFSDIWIDSFLRNDNYDIRPEIHEFIDRSIEVHKNRNQYDLEWEFPGGMFWHQPVSLPD